MVDAESLEDDYGVRFTNAIVSAVADTTEEKGGADSGFRPHDLLEAALASCLNISVRMRARKLAYPLTGVRTRVSLDRSSADAAVFEYSIEIDGPLSGAQRRELLAAAETSSVRATLGREISFRAGGEGAAKD